VVTRIGWSATLALVVLFVVSPLWSRANRDTTDYPGGARLAMVSGAGQDAGQPLVAGVDGPVPQPINDLPATPFGLAAIEVRTMGELLAAQAAADAAPPTTVPRTPRPEFEIEGRRELPQHPAAPGTATWPPGSPDLAARLDGPRALTTGVAIEGPTLTDTLSFPPDSMGDVGPTQYFVALNGEMRVYDKANGTLVPGLAIEPDNFFSSTVRNGAGTTDPRVRFDRLSGRWFVLYITIAIPNRVVLAVSDGQVITPSTVWSFYAINNTVQNQTAQPCLADYPTLGIDASALYIGVNQFCGASVGTASFFNSSGYVVNKASLLAAPPASASVTLFSPLIVGGTGPYTPQGADNPDAAATVGFFAGVDFSQFGQLSMVRISQPGGTPSASAALPVVVPTTAFPLNAPHGGSTKPLDALDDRLINAVVRAGRLYAAHAIRVDGSGVGTSSGDRTAVRWYEVEGISGTPTLRQSGTIFDATPTSPLFYWVPSININGSGDIAVGYAASGTATFAGGAVSHRLAADPLGTMQAPVTVAAGSAVYTPPGDFAGASYRWGDYTMVSVDPANDATFWTAQMYGRFTNVYGTRFVQFSVTGGAPPPPVAEPDTYSTPFNTTLTVAAPGVLANDSTNGGGPLTASLVTSVARGTLIFNASGGFTYIPLNGYTGPDSFTYRVANGNGESLATSVTLTVLGATPTAVGDTYFTPRDTTLQVPQPGVLANDNSNGGGAMTAALVAGPANGLVALDASGSFVYTPSAGFVGTDTFTYQASNANGAGSVASVAIAVLAPGVPQPPADLSVVSVVGNRITLRFTPPSIGPSPTNYVLRGGATPGEVAASLPTGSTQAIFTFDGPTGVYYVRLHTVSGSNESGPSNEIRLVVNTPVAPSAPANLLGLVNGSTISLAWRNTFAGGAPTSLLLDVTGTAATTIPLGLSEGFSMMNVPPGTYTLALRAANGAGVSPASNAVTLTFPGACTGAPSAPVGLLAARSGNVLTVIWEPPASGAAPTGYALVVSGGLNGVFTTAGRALAGTVPSGNYTLQVYAFNPCGNGPVAPPITVDVP
jgi:hypothetical protein